MTTSDWLTILAVLVAPLVAIQVSELLEHRKQRRERQLSVFKTLMSTRASGLAPEHVAALNTIDIEFYGRDKQSKAVLYAWKAYVDHLNAAAVVDQMWNTRREDLFVDLLFEMATKLGYDFDKTTIRRTSYFPRGYGDTAVDELAIRKGVVALLDGTRPLPVALKPPDTLPDGQPKLAQPK